MIRVSEETGAKSPFPKGLHPRRQRNSSRPVVGGPETIALLKEDSRVPNGAAISSSNISSSNSLEGHPDLIEKPQLFTPKTSRDKDRHKICIALPEKGGSGKSSVIIIEGEEEMNFQRALYQVGVI